MDYLNQAAQAYAHQQTPGSQASGPPHQGQSQGQGYYPPHQPSPQPHRSPVPPQASINAQANVLSTVPLPLIQALLLPTLTTIFLLAGQPNGPPPIGAGFSSIKELVNARGTTLLVPLLKHSIQMCIPVGGDRWALHISSRK
ncbi:MAG: hypothetical protein Q9175_005323 [Cornicularia normoerica]